MIGGGQLITTGGGVGGALTLKAPIIIHPLLASSAREARRIHLSGYPIPCSEAVLRETIKAWSDTFRRQMINTEMGEEKLSPDAKVNVDHVLDVFISTGNSNYAFIELNTQDMATKLVMEDETMTMTSAAGEIKKLRVRRPNNYKDMSAHDPNRVVVISPPELLSADQYNELFEQFGEKKGSWYEPGKFFYVQYEDDESVHKAVQALNGQVIGNYALVVQRATAVVRVQMQQLGHDVPVPEDQADGRLVIGGNTGRDMIRELLDLDHPATKAMSVLKNEYPHLRTPGPIPIFPTKILVLFNMIDETELDDDEDFYELEADIREEVEKYGRVEDLIIPRHPPLAPKPPKPLDLPDLPDPPKKVVGLLKGGDGSAVSATSGEPARELPPDPAQVAYDEAVLRNKRLEEEFEKAKAEFHQARKQWELDLNHPVKAGVGRVFVEYATVDEAALAQKKIAGKLFNGRTVITSFLFEDILHPPIAEDEDALEGETAEERTARMADLFEAKEAAAQAEMQQHSGGGAKVPATNGDENAGGATEDID